MKSRSEGAMGQQGEGEERETSAGGEAKQGERRGAEWGQGKERDVR